VWHLWRKNEYPMAGYLAQDRYFERHTLFSVVRHEGDGCEYFCFTDLSEIRNREFYRHVPPSAFYEQLSVPIPHDFYHGFSDLTPYVFDKCSFIFALYGRMSVRDELVVYLSDESFCFGLYFREIIHAFFVVTELKIYLLDGRILCGAVFRCGECHGAINEEIFRPLYILASGVMPQVVSALSSVRATAWAITSLCGLSGSTGYLA
jgi:hypothetical protein